MSVEVLCDTEWGEFPASACAELEDGRMCPLDRCVDTDYGRYCEDDCVSTYDGQDVPVDNAILLANGEFADEDDPDIVCLHNGEYWFIDQCSEVGNEWYRNEDCFTCDNCGDSELLDDAVYVHDHETVCQHCYDYHYATCDSCCETFRAEEINEHGMCSDCRPSSLILNYCNKSANHLKPESQDAMLFGIELEVESCDGNEDDGASYVRSHLPEDYCVFKEDSSLGDGGFEIVTRPDSMAVHKRKWESLLSDRPGRHIYSWDTEGRCGMHVHITKSALSPLQMGKMLVFLNEPCNGSFVKCVAGRSGAAYASRCKRKHTDIDKLEDRTVALNITSRTAEVRIFRGTLKRESFLKNLEFVTALVEYCGPAKFGLRQAASHKEFCKWLSRKDYPNLWAHLKDRGYVMEK